MALQRAGCAGCQQHPRLVWCRDLSKIYPRTLRQVCGNPALFFSSSFTALRLRNIMERKDYRGVDSSGDNITYLSEEEGGHNSFM